MDLRKEKKKGTNDTVSKKNSSWAETLLPILVFALTLVFFSSFQGLLSYLFWILCVCLRQEKDAENLIVKEKIIEEEKTTKIQWFILVLLWRRRYLLVLW
jgi:hypothetical protein